MTIEFGENDVELGFDSFLDFLIEVKDNEEVKKLMAKQAPDITVGKPVFLDHDNREYLEECINEFLVVEEGPDNEKIIVSNSMLENEDVDPGVAKIISDLEEHEINVIQVPSGGGIFIDLGEFMIC